MQLRRLVPALALPLVLAVSSCSSDGSRSASTGGTGAGAVAALSTSVAGLSSARFALSATVAGQALTATGVQRLSGGKLTGLQAEATLPALGKAAIVIDGSERFVKLPAPLAPAAKPWVRVTTTSSDIVIKQLASVLDAALTVGDLGNLNALTAAAGSVRTIGSEQVNGSPATRYAVVVKPAKLPAALTAGGGLGTADIPVDLWLDAAKRPVKVHAALSLAGEKTDATITFSDFDVPVTITRPAADLITTG